MTSSRKHVLKFVYRFSTELSSLKVWFCKKIPTYQRAVFKVSLRDWNMNQKIFMGFKNDWHLEWYCCVQLYRWLHDGNLKHQMHHFDRICRNAEEKNWRNHCISKFILFHCCLDKVDIPKTRTKQLHIWKGW